jgi:type IV secretory pathway component VirB8
MGFDDFLESKHSYRGNYNKHRYYDDDNRYFHESHHSRDSHHNNHGHFNWLNILDKIRSNKKLKWFIIIAGILVLVIGIALIIVLLPLIVKLFNYIIQNGLQEVFNDITGFLEKIWKGSGK